MAPPTPRRARQLAVLTLACLTAVLAFAATAAAAERPLEIGFGDRLFGDSPAARAQALDETQSVHGSVVRLDARWSSIAPGNPSAGFDATDPADPEYNWGNLDDQVRDADARGLRVLILVHDAPRWAEGEDRPDAAPAGTWKPDPGDLADFGTAIATRYSGTFNGLPRVRDFLCWGEANLRLNLTPLWGGKSGKRPVAPEHYRQMLNAFYEAVHAVQPDATVVTAETAPYGADPGVLNMRPLLFWRKLLCVKDNARLSPTKRCEKPEFDVLAHNPINTSGPPGLSALNDDDVSTPDVHNLVDVLRASERAGNALPDVRHPVWATEIWWESNPPDPHPLNPTLKKQARWYAQALYSLWRQGASMVLLLQVRDTAYDGEPGRFGGNYQSGVFFVDGSAKPSATAIRFPFVAERRSSRKIRVWGIAPQSGMLKVTKGGHRIARFKVEQGAIFSRVVSLKERGGAQVLRAEVNGARSLEFRVEQH
jgi:hypothetical protein